MKVLRNKTTLSTAIIEKCGTCYKVTINNLIKIYDKEQSATNYILSLGYEF